MKNEFHISARTLVQFWLVLLAIAAIVVAIWAARWAIVMILVAFFLALVLNRPTEFFARVLPGHSRGLGATITFLITLIILGGVVTLIVPIFLEQTAVFLKSLPDTLAHVQSETQWIGFLIAEYGLTDTFNAMVTDAGEQFKSFAASLGGMSINFLTDAVAMIANTFIIAVLTLFMLIEGPTWLQKFWDMFPDKKKRAKYQGLANKMYDVVSEYVIGQVIVATICGILAGVGVFVLSLTFGLPSTLILPISAITFITTFIPIFGPIVGCAVAFILALLYNPIAAVILLVYLTVYQQVLWNFVSPKVQSRQIKISALAILIAIVIGMTMGGVFGAIVAVPIAGCVIVLFRYYLSQKTKPAAQSTK